MSNNELVEILKKAQNRIYVAKNTFDPLFQQLRMSEALKEIEKALELIKNGQ